MNMKQNQNKMPKFENQIKRKVGTQIIVKIRKTNEMKGWNSNEMSKFEKQMK